jgi:hypothetical protein
VGVVFLALTFGTLVGSSLVDLAPHFDHTVESHPLSDWWKLPALVAVTVGSMIRFRARPNDAVLIFAASALALFGARWGTEFLGSTAGPFVAALLLGLVGTWVSRLIGCTPELVIIPGIVFLILNWINFKTPLPLAIDFTKSLTYLGDPAALCKSNLQARRFSQALQIARLHGCGIKSQRLESGKTAQLLQVLCRKFLAANGE